MDTSNANQAYGLVESDTLASRSGLDLLRAMMRGELPGPPIARTLDFSLSEAEHGFVVFTGTPQFMHYNPLGSVHGGYHATLLDSAMACAVHSTLAVGQAYTSLEIKVNFVRALTEATGPVRAEGRVINVGRQIATAEGRLVDAKGKLYSHGTTTCFIFAASSNLPKGG